MSRKLNGWGPAALLIVALVVITGCADTAQQEADASATARQEAWVQLEQQKEELEATRQELADLKARVAEEEAEGAEAPEGEAVEGETVEDPQARIAQLESQVADETEAFYTALVEFLNEQPMVEGEEPSELQAAAIRMKSGEDMLVAEEYVTKGGNYRRAIDIYESALAVDPDNPELQTALAEAEANRYMSEERFSQIEEGMTTEEVQNLLGTPFHANVRDFPDDNVTAWFYPVDPQGSAAAVWFRERNGEMKAYKVDYEEVVKEGPTEVNGEAAEEPAEG